MTKTGFAFRRITAASILLLGVSLGACSDDDNDDDGGGGSTAATDYAGLVSSTDGQTGPLTSSLRARSQPRRPPEPAARARAIERRTGERNRDGSLGRRGARRHHRHAGGGTLNMTGAGGR